MMQSRHDLDLSREAIAAECKRELGLEDFDGNSAMMARVFRLVHRSHGAAAELSLDAVSTRKRGLERLRPIDHGAAHPRCVESRWCPIAADASCIARGSSRSRAEEVLPTGNGDLLLP